MPEDGLKLSEFDALTVQTIDSFDEVLILDKSDTTQGPDGSTKTALVGAVANDTRLVALFTATSDEGLKLDGTPWAELEVLSPAVDSQTFLYIGDPDGSAQNITEGSAQIWIYKPDPVPDVLVNVPYNATASEVQDLLDDVAPGVFTISGGPLPDTTMTFVHPRGYGWEGGGPFLGIDGLTTITSSAEPWSSNGYLNAYANSTQDSYVAICVPSATSLTDFGLADLNPFEDGTSVIATPVHGVGSPLRGRWNEADDDPEVDTFVYVYKIESVLNDNPTTAGEISFSLILTFADDGVPGILRTFAVPKDAEVTFATSANIRNGVAGPEATDGGSNFTSTHTIGEFDSYLSYLTGFSVGSVAGDNGFNTGYNNVLWNVGDSPYLTTTATHTQSFWGSEGDAGGSILIGENDFSVYSWVLMRITGRPIRLGTATSEVVGEYPLYGVNLNLKSNEYIEQVLYKVDESWTARDGSYIPHGIIGTATDSLYHWDEVGDVFVGPYYEFGPSNRVMGSIGIWGGFNSIGTEWAYPDLGEGSYQALVSGPDVWFTLPRYSDNFQPGGDEWYTAGQMRLWIKVMRIGAID